MPDPVDFFADGLQAYMGAYGCALHFNLSTDREHNAPSETPPREFQGVRVATVRITPEFAKGMVFYLYQRVRQYERDNGPISLPTELLRRLIGDEQQAWDRIWEHGQ